MQTLRIEHLTKTYGEKTLFEDANFIINEHDRIGLIGTNGSGKTTLLNALTGLDPADSGKLIKPNDYRIGYLTQLPEFDENKTIMDAIFEGASPIFQTIREYENALSKYSENPENEKLQKRYDDAEKKMNQEDAWNADSEVKTILTQLQIKDLTQKIKTLSGGQKKRVGLAQVLIQAPDLLILDEPTNHLDFDSIEWLEKYLSNYKGALLVVTHDRYFLDQVATKIMELSFGKLYSYEGNYEDYVAQKAERIERELTQEHKQQQLYKKELAWIRTGAKARTTKQQARINHFHDLEKSVNNKVKVDQNVQINLGSQRLGKKVLQLENASKKVGSHLILNHFNMMINAGDRIGITGLNGAGKSTLLNILAGKLALDEGKLITGETVKLAYYQQQTEPIPEDKRIINYLNEVGQSVVNKDGERVSTTQLLEQFLFPRFMHGTLIRKLSGGEKRRLYLLKLLIQQPNVLLLDEPTNDLDIGTLTVLEDYLDNFDGTVITVSHDRYFLDKVADQLYIFDGNAQIERYSGLLTDYLKKSIGNQAKVTENKKEKSKQENKKSVSKTKKKLTYAQRLEYETLEKQIDELDNKRQELQNEMEATLGTDYAKLGDLQREIDQIDEESMKKMERWEELDQIANQN